MDQGAAARAGLATALALAGGTAAGHPDWGALAAMGAVNGITTDTATGYRRRMTGIVIPQLACVVGLTLGPAIYAHGWLTVAVVTSTALVSGIISAIGPIASAFGLLLLLNTVVGAGLPMPGAWWLPPVLSTAGAVLFLAVLLVAWPLRPLAPERAAVASAYGALTQLLASCDPGTPLSYEEARRSMTLALNRAHELVTPGGRGGPRRGERAHLDAQLRALAPLVEAAPLVRLSDRALPPAYLTGLQTLTADVASGSPTDPEPPLPAPSTAADCAVREGLLEAAAVVAAAHRDRRETPQYVVAQRSAALGSGAARSLAMPATAWRYGMRLALCIGLAQAFINVIPVPRSYWVPLTVTFVLKPDFGSVFSRAVLRVLGTVPGLVVAAAVLAMVSRGWWDVPLVLVLAALVPVLAPRGYAHQTAAVTPLILLLSDLLNRQGTAVLLPRLIDSAIGCAITLIAGYALWPESWHTRVGARLADAVEDCALYLEGSFNPSVPAAECGHRRRSVYRDLSAVRIEMQRALSEPPPAGLRAAAWSPLVDAAERIVDGTTAARTEVLHGAAPPTALEVSALVHRVRMLAVHLRERGHASPLPLPSQTSAVAERLPRSSADVLEPLERDVAAMEATTLRMRPLAAVSG
ncbi:FUSC family protein [Streptomyces sp. NPDC059786]|uniref:FUSC family protein n=1 Tax=Streptomyces sp. NPDC059786 TaxID=3346946 RepID=UPI00365130A1